MKPGIPAYLGCAMSDYESILAAATSLPFDDQKRLVDDLCAAMPDDPHGAALSQEWLDEIKRRSQAIDDGTAVLIDGDEVFRELRKRYTPQ